MAWRLEAGQLLLLPENLKAGVADWRLVFNGYGVSQPQPSFPPLSRETQTPALVSWERAQKDARRWVDSLNLPTRSLKGKSVDLTAQALALARTYPEPKYRTMVIRAAKRLLTTRGVTATIPEPEPLTGEEPAP